MLILTIGAATLLPALLYEKAADLRGHIKYKINKRRRKKRSLSSRT